MWANKLLSRNPTEPELNFWGNLIAVTSDLATVAFIAEGDRYLSVTQARFVESTLATAPGTVIVTGPQVISAGYGPDGSGTVVLAARVVPPAVGGHLVVSNDANPAAGGVGKVTVLTPSAGDQTTVQVVAAGLTGVRVGENFDARVAAKVTRRVAVTVTGLTVSGACSTVTSKSATSSVSTQEGGPKPTSG